MLKINVLIVTYKQALVIGRTIESILQQKDYGLNKIVICDDCSPDNNWDIIQSYVTKYSGLIDAYRNENNLGIYGNSNKLITLRGDADFYCWLEGDDALCDGFFREIQNANLRLGVNREEKVAIMSNFLIKNVDGTELSDSRNSIINNQNDYFGLYIRGLISWRASVFSEALMATFKPAILDKGLSLAESSFDCQFFRALDKAYYIPINGSVYHAGIGVSVNLNDTKSAYKSTEGIIQWEYYIHNLVSKRIDTQWCRANLTRCAFYLKPSIGAFIKAVYFYITGTFPIYKISIKKIVIFIKPMIRCILK